ncbi:MAG: glycosyltransferase family 2 protein [Alphaproteobacteria bacterium]
MSGARDLETSRLQAGARAASLQTGEILVEQGLLTVSQLRQALELQRAWKMRIGEIVMAKGWVRALDFYQALAQRMGTPFVNLVEEPVDAALLDPRKVDEYVRWQYVPWRAEGGESWFVSPDPLAATRHLQETDPGCRPNVAVTSKFDILWTIQEHFSDDLTRKARLDLYLSDPVSSARNVMTGRQVTAVYILASLVLLCFSLAPVRAAIVSIAVMSVLFLVSFAFKLLLVLIGANVPSLDHRITEEDVRALNDDTLPIYTILVPMYHEPRVLPILASAIRRLDYPLAKLDVKLVLEEDDLETLEAAKLLGLESIFEIVRVPASDPKTKPKACNYALAFARGEYLVIFDAEDKPEPDQLKKAVVAMRKSSENVVCFQARLNYYNVNENWLTRLFTIDYSLWYDFMLPALEFLDLPIPLGGTSNHFRTEFLKELRAWDPFNVTEDADLGIRMTQKGYRVGVINSTTFEEANCNVGNWIRQRSRWLKGYMQTYLVHMRHPVKLYKSTGHSGFWGFQLFVGGTALTALLNPVFWFIYAFWLVSQSELIEVFFPSTILYVSLASLIIGNMAFVYLALLAPLKRQWFDLVPYGLTFVAYWVLISLAAYKGLWQLVTRPFYWEKTHHGISRTTAQELEAARE